MRYLFLACLLLAILAPVVGQDEKPCHDDEHQVTDSRGGYRCVPTEETMSWPATACVKDFKVSDQTTLVAPLFTETHKPDLNRARLENFEFKMVCGVPK